jgi:pimeloyl-ACP methyl ester carboxylesterase
MSFRFPLIPVAAAALAVGLTAKLALKEDELEIEQMGEITLVGNKLLHTLHLPKNDNYIIFIHGFGGQMAQFKYQIDFLSNKCSIFSIDFVGHGKSLEGKHSSDYTIDSIVNDVYNALADLDLCAKNIVVVGHSLGALVTAKLSKMIKLQGVVLIAPKAEFSEKASSGMRKLGKMNRYFFEGIRYVDKIGGTKSTSVNRIMSDHASPEARELQLAFNKATPTSVVQNMLANTTATKAEDFKIEWCQSILLMAGEFDQVTPIPMNVPRVAEVNDISSENILLYPAGHNLMLELPDRVNSDIWNFACAIFNK